MRSIAARRFSLIPTPPSQLHGFTPSLSRPLMSRLQQISFPLRGEFITLDRLLKACSLANSGGQAKLMVADGLVQVDGQQELRKTAKIRAGQVVSMAGVRIRVEPEEGGMTPAVTGE